MSFALEEGEKESYHDTAKYENKPARLIVTNKRVVIISKSEVVFEISYFQISNFKYQKKTIENPTNNTSTRFRIIDFDGNNHDVKFTGIESPNSLKKSVELIRSFWKKAKEEKEKEESIPEEEMQTPEEKEKKEAIVVSPENRLYNELYQLDAVKNMYTELVESGIISNDEFWNNFKVESSEYTVHEAYQSPGYSGRLLSSVTAKSSEGSNNVTFFMTPEIVRQIFAKKPTVAKMHQKFLEENKTDDDGDFWFQYFKKKEMKRQKRNDKEHNIFKNVKIDTLKFDEIAQSKRYKQLEPASISGPIGEEIPGMGNFNKESLPSLSDRKISNMNTHSELALIENGVVPNTIENGEIPSERPLNVPNYFEDLIPREEIPVKNLVIEEKKKQENEVLEPASEFAQCAGEFADMMSCYESNFLSLPLPVVADFANARCVLKEITPEQNTFFAYSQENLRDMRIRNEVDKLRTHKMEQQILLYHFWNNYFGVKQENKEKALRLKQKIEEFKEMLHNEMHSIPTETLQQQVSPLYKEMEESIEKVLSLYQEKHQAAAEEFDINSFFN
ncbi:BSD domain (BTF2-like transcription factor, Synapse-associated proteins and DOS2-like proteins) [Histomonas meleagridis]|uniref:BTF2-like transcription factor n=1 Tax=Histomonas meleagridis TaxID=135588 RepID=UPI0035598FA0|nr:BSD domain (BTF2-like transcription factor, Synapse-associated proteins and DOS2-like proteins) [Histomonas meleagridis]KAH0800390.1 BTF2-like transcription factor [Histomonas meleagridis]